MSETKWTLPGQEFGPWESLPGGAIVRTQFRRGDDTRPGFVVADLGTSPLERRADIAALIAAAPDLYAALDDCHVYQSNGRWRIGWKIDGRGAWSVEIPAEARPFFEAWNQRREAALSKARGES